MRSTYCIALILSFSSIVACTTKDAKYRKLQEPLNTQAAFDQPNTDPAQIVATAETAQLVGTPKVDTLGPDPCMELPKLDFSQPVYLPGAGAVLTRILKTCQTRDGKQGMESNSPWLAMGFPCSDGGGRVEVKGNIHAPKMVSFIISTDCSMSANNKDSIKKQFSDVFNLPVTSKLMAVNPFAVHFWEIPGMPDADTGFVIELRSAPAIEGGWKRLLRDQEKLRVRLFGRENAWVRGDHFYLVEADIALVGTTRFKLEVASVKVLKPDELEALKLRCRVLRTARNCDEIF